MRRLHPDQLGSLNAGVLVPAYDRGALKPGIVHLGPGAFHRAHQAVFTDQAIANSGGEWGIVGVSLRSPAVAEQLNPQGGLYSVLNEDAHSAELRVVGAIQYVLVAPQEPERVAAAIADESIHIITLTITEKGYAIAADGASLNSQDAGIRADLADPLHPASALGTLALGLKKRLESTGAPLTIISCDNLAENSRLLREVLGQYLQRCFPAVIPWLEQSVAFPCSMVDRIVPAMTEAQKQRQAELLGLNDEGAVATEPFRQWIIEDCFAADRPDWESAGVQFVNDIRPFEDIKLRLLNGSHSAIAYAGLLAHLETVDQVVADPVLGRFIETLMARDLMPALHVPVGFDIAAYRDQLLARFGNPRLHHRCQQIAMDGTEKIPQRWLPTLQAQGSPHLVKALSVWCYFVLCTDLPIDDPRAAGLLEVRNDSGAMADRIARALSQARVSGESLQDFDALVSGLVKHMQTIEERGVRALLTV